MLAPAHKMPGGTTEVAVLVCPLPTPFSTRPTCWSTAIPSVRATVFWYRGLKLTYLLVNSCGSHMLRVEFRPHVCRRGEVHLAAFELGSREGILPVRAIWAAGMLRL